MDITEKQIIKTLNNKVFSNGRLGKITKWLSEQEFLKISQKRAKKSKDILKKP